MKVCWFSTGISSFVACYLAKDVDEIIYTHVSNQHPDSLRFLPEKKEYIVPNDNVESQKDIIAVGWNACLREITETSDENKR